MLLDANTIWHLRLAEALGNIVQLTVVNPRSGWIPSIHRTKHRGAMMFKATLPRGWASSTSFLGQRILAWILARNADGWFTPPVVILTSPVYAPLLQMLPDNVPIVSYTSDDYRSYEGWGGIHVVQKEREICRRSVLSVFVSETLRQRAIEEFDLDRKRTLVSPNATERRFAERGYSRPTVLEGRATPVVGVLGALSSRLDLEALAGVVASPAVATFLVAGPADPKALKRYPVFCSEKVIITGNVPHEEMHLFASAIDVALIPYARSELNLHCSPMRLYDHLASGVPIVALEGCDQIDRCASPSLSVVQCGKFSAAVEKVISSGLNARNEVVPDLFWHSRAELIVAAIEEAVNDNLMVRSST